MRKIIGLIIGVLLFNIIIFDTKAEIYKDQDYWFNTQTGITYPYDMQAYIDSFDVAIITQTWGMNRWEIHGVNIPTDKVVVVTRDSGRIKGFFVDSDLNLNTRETITFNYRTYDNYGNKTNESTEPYIATWYSSAESNSYTIRDIKNCYVFTTVNDWNSYYLSGNTDGLLADTQTTTNILYAPTYINDTLRVQEGYLSFDAYFDSMNSYSSVGSALLNQWLLEQHILDGSYKLYYHDLNGVAGVWENNDMILDEIAKFTIDYRYIGKSNVGTSDAWTTYSNGNAVYRLRVDFSKLPNILNKQVIFDKFECEYYYRTYPDEESTNGHFEVNAIDNSFSVTVNNNTVNGSTNGTVLNNGNFENPQQQFFKPSNEYSYSDDAWGFVTSGFGLFGNNGFFALMTQLFSFLPSVIVTAFTTMITVTFGVIIYKLIRG